MPDISKITLPSGMTYDLKDATARQQIATILGATTITFIGVSSVELTDGGNETPKVNNENITPKAGNLFFYGTQEFIYGTDNKWHALGSLDSLGALAYKNNATATYAPAGSVSAPTISITTAGTTNTIHNPTKVTVAKSVIATAPGAAAPSNAITYYSVSDETLNLYQLGYTTGDSITTSDVTVKTGDAIYSASQPTFTGTQATITVE